MSDSRILPQMEIVGSDGLHVGTVDRLEPGHIKLTRGDDPARLGGHRRIPLDAVAEIEPGRVRLRIPSNLARAMAAGGHGPEQMEEGYAGTGIPVPSPSGPPETEQPEEGAQRGAGSQGEGFRGDPNMDPSGRGEV